jgi:2-hydroxychromene-2-carboxylate isomerase
MKNLIFYFDPISPFAYLAFDALPEVLAGLSYSVSYKPVFLGALLKHYGQLGPAEVPPKRDWTYRHVQWLAHRRGLQLQMPALHPFNSLSLLRLAVASDPQGLPNRYAVERLFRHVWRGGLDATDAAALQALREELVRVSAMDDDEAKARLKAHTDDAIAAQVFGVPAIEVDAKVFWGLDALPMLRSYLDGNAWFADPKHWEGVGQIPSGVALRTSQR